MDAKLASKMDQQGKSEQQVNQVCFRKLACWGQLEVIWTGKSEISKTPGPILAPSGALSLALLAADFRVGKLGLGVQGGQGHHCVLLRAIAVEAICIGVPPL